MENGSLIGKTYAYDENGNQISETDQEAGKQTVYEYDADNRLRKATGRTGETVDYVQENKYNGFGQRVQKKEGSDVTEYFYDGSTVLYTEDAQDKVTSFNLIGAENNILQTARADQDDAVNFYTYTKDLRESTINIVGADGTSQVTYDYDDYGETKTYDKDSASPFYNEVCYTAGIYDKTTGLYNLNARLRSRKRRVHDTGHIPRQPLENSDAEPLCVLHGEPCEIHRSEWPLDLGSGRRGTWSI